MTFVLGVAMGLFAAAVTVAYRARRLVADRQLPAHECDEFGSYQRIGNSRVYDWPDESDGIDIPLDGPPMVIIPMQQVYDELHLALWEDELEDHE